MEFTKEELELLHECVEADFYASNWPKSMYTPLIAKIQSELENYELKPELIVAYETGLGVTHQFFCSQQAMTTDDLIPVIEKLAENCDGMIRKSGIYAIRLTVHKIK